MTNQNLASQIIAKSLVTRPRGTWQWQDAFAISDCYAKLAANGRVIWAVLNSSGKLSMPQIERGGIDFDYHHGVCGKQVSRAYAIGAIGHNAVKKIEDHGWQFAQ